MNPNNSVWRESSSHSGRGRSGVNGIALDSDTLCAAARRRTKLEDFGEPPITPALPILTRSLVEEADLHPLGQFLMRSHLQELLETRLRLTNLWNGLLQSSAELPVS